MERFTPKKLRPWVLTSLLLRTVIRLLELWPLVLILAMFLSPIKPYMRIQYHYFYLGKTKIMTDCDYLGLYGFTDYRAGSSCPFIIMIDSGENDAASNFLRTLLRTIL
jgi:hypothetical protein